MRKLLIASEFSRYPAGRFKTDGPYSGEHFRETFLAPLMKDPAPQVELVFDGARGYGSSFLEEAFGGLVRIGFDRNEILRKFILTSEKDPSLIAEIRSYIQQADA